MKLSGFIGKTVKSILGDGEYELTITFEDGTQLFIEPDGRQGAKLSTTTVVDKVITQKVKEKVTVDK